MRSLAVAGSHSPPPAPHCGLAPTDADGVVPLHPPTIARRSNNQCSATRLTPTRRALGANVEGPDRRALRTSQGRHWSGLALGHFRIPTLSVPHRGERPGPPVMDPGRDSCVSAPRPGTQHRIQHPALVRTADQVHPQGSALAFVEKAFTPWLPARPSLSSRFKRIAAEPEAWAK